MDLPIATTLLFAPTGQYVEAFIVVLTPEIAERRIHRAWWNDADLVEYFNPLPIDRWWNWNEMEIEFDGRKLAHTSLAIVTGDQQIQGAMTISTDSVPSALEPGASALFVELLFTAPRNRSALRRDGLPFFVGVGTKLLNAAASLSREKSCEGRLILDGSPEFVVWYEKRGLQKLNANPIVFEGVEYTPMELSKDAARRLLENRT